MPYAYPAPTTTGVPGSEGTTKADKPAAAQSMAAATIPKVSGSTALPPRVSVLCGVMFMTSSCCAGVAWKADLVRPSYFFREPRAPRLKGWVFTAKQVPTV